MRRSSEVEVIFDNPNAQVQRYDDSTIVWWQPQANPALIVAAVNTLMTYLYTEGIRVVAFEANCLHDPDNGTQWVGVEFHHMSELVEVDDDGNPLS